MKALEWLKKLLRPEKRFINLDLLGNVRVPIHLRLVYVTLPEGEKREVEKLYREDLKKGLFGGERVE